MTEFAVFSKNLMIILCKILKECLQEFKLMGGDKFI